MDIFVAVSVRTRYNWFLRWLLLPHPFRTCASSMIVERGCHTAAAAAGAASGGRGLAGQPALERKAATQRQRSLTLSKYIC